ncbi:hypothetical protein BDGGKGIB_01391 [Nodularia sphaerocarpa UHCC 0038]|nr:hypothetical protein BDGGKGIB_01391 [Nodularia sphaerocarpa UHCC 0038]
MHIIKHRYGERASVDHRFSVTRKKTGSSCLNKGKLPIDTFDPHSDRMARHNLKTLNRF